MKQQGMWNRWILLFFWTAHALTTLEPVYTTLRYVFRHLSESSSYLTTTPFLGLLIWLALTPYEILAFKRQNLHPIVYLASQVFKSFFSVYWYFPTIPYRLRYYLAVYTLYTIALLLGLLSFHVAALYAIYVVYLWSTKRTWTDARNGASSIFVLPRQINSSARIRAEIPWIMELTQWLDRDQSWVRTLLGPSAAIIQAILFAFKYIISIVLFAILLVFSGRLPGEIESSSIVTHQLPSDKWDYLNPSMKEDHISSDSVDALIAASADEELGNDDLTLHRIYQRSRTTPRSHSAQTGHELIPSTRLFGPRYLCFLNNDSDGTTSSQYTVRRVDDSSADNKNLTVPDYIFVSYTRMQFYTQTSFDSRTPSRLLSTFKAAADRDRATLTEYAIVAAKQAGVPAFWVDFECVRPEYNDQAGDDIEDVYRICDIVRAAHSLIIVLGPSLDQDLQHIDLNACSKSELLFEWGRRMWTVPEALLCPSEHRITIYSIEMDEPESVAKRNLAVRVWEDADVLRQLIDHYEGSLRLTQLELISISLECLSRRHTNRHNAGDVAYVLMGLLRLRPKVNKSDTDFQAFARLSIANDSNRILERILTLRNPEGSVWHDTDDLWGTKLWHLNPLYQITSIGSKETVVIGESSGTSIDWTSLKPVEFITTGKRPGLIIGILRGSAISVPMVSPMWAVMGFAQTPATLLLAYILIFLLLPAVSVPAFMRRHFQKPFVTTQARLFGICGKPDLDIVESSIFGVSRGRLRWSSDGLFDGVVDDDRATFTLIDTLSCTATCFKAGTAPTMAFAGAQERGKLRVVLCSYDRVSQAFVKENVIRVGSDSLQRMPRLDNFRFSDRRNVYKDAEIEASRQSFDSDMMDIPEVPEFRTLDDV